MAISIQKTSIEGLTLIHPHVFEDQRGYFIKDFEKSVYEQIGNELGIKWKSVQKTYLENK